MTIKNNFAIELHHVFETYSLEIKTEKQLICEKFEALKDISFSVNKSEAIAIIGSNGAGKSTLLRIIAGLLKPEKGQVEISGRVSSLLDLGAGFHPEMTGRDNLLLNASLYNFNREEMRTKIEQVLLFADIGKFIDIPVRCYSQGMYVRLAFSLAIHVDPDIILIDDCLAVGDDNFRLKCIDKVLEFKSKGKTIILVTHDFSTARQVCERGIYLKDGRIYRDASLDDVIHSYITPLVIDKNCYKYLGAKITVQENLERDRRQREADQQRMEQEAWRHAQEEQNYLEQKAWRHAQDERNHLEQEAWRHAQEERNRLEQEAWRHAQEERNRLEQEAWCHSQEERHRLEQERRRIERAKRYASIELVSASGLRVVIAPAKVHIFLHHQKLTDKNGIYLLFEKGQFRDIPSTATYYWLIKVSDTRAVCFMRWVKPVHVCQIWYWTVMPDGMIDLRIESKSLSEQSIDNSRIECCLQGKRGAIQSLNLSGKEKIMSLGDSNNVVFMTRQDDQITGSYSHGEGRETIYFLTVCNDAVQLPIKRDKRSLVFSGMFGVVNCNDFPVFNMGETRHVLIKGGLKLYFKEGSCCLEHNGKMLTTGMGLYTSLYSRNIWSDSTQARWSIVSADTDRLIVKGCWPWVPVVQLWDVQLVSDTKICLDLRMRVLQEFPLKVYETALMMTPEYQYWSAAKDFHTFPKDVTRDDFFRICLSSHEADGKNQFFLRGDGISSIIFSPYFMPYQRIIVENVTHMGGAPARLLHCLRVNDQQDILSRAGEYDLFKGDIDISGGLA